MINLTESDIAVLKRRVKARGRPLVYNIDHLKPWEVYELPSHLVGQKLLSAVNAVTRAGKRRGWTMARVGPYRMVRMGDGPIPVLNGESF